MTFIQELLGNKALVSAFVGWLVANVTKMIIEIITGEFTLKRFVGTGGMPSTHSATVAALCTATGMKEGVSSTLFAISAILAIIVIYDARGVRFMTGKQSKILNALKQRDEAEGKEPIYDTLDENSGHTLPEVAVGTLIGIVMAVIICNL